jgi:type I restriction enzyme R subunit
VDDGATVPIYYESRLAKLNIDQSDIEALNDEVDDIIEDEEDVAARESTKSQWAALEKLVGSEPRISKLLPIWSRILRTGSPACRARP